MAIMIIRCKIYFVFFIFVVCANHENIFTTKISRSTVVTLANFLVCAESAYYNYFLNPNKSLLVLLQQCIEVFLTKKIITPQVERKKIK